MDGLVLRGLLLSYAVGVVLQVTSATLTINHGRVTFISGQSSSIIVQEVEGVAVLDLGGTTRISQYFDCISTNGVTNLVWERDGGAVRFPSSVRGNELRLNMAPDNADPVDYPDLDIYTCRDTVTGDRKSINVTGGNIAICPVVPSLEIGVGGSIALSVYVAGNPSIMSSEIIWYAPDNSVITSGGRYSLLDSNTRLLLRGAELGDSGTYRIDIRRHLIGTTFTMVTSTIDLDVQVDPGVVLNPNSLMVMEHNPVTLTCTFTGNPAPTITWEREGTVSLPVETRRSITSTSELNSTVKLYTVASVFEIYSVLYEDEGRYRCSATNTKAGSQRTDTSTYAVLTVTPRLIFAANVDQSPYTIEDGGLIQISDSSRVGVHCTGSGTLSWHSSSGADIPVTTVLSPTINVFQRRDLSNNRQTLTIQSFSSVDTAIYTCRTDLTITGNSIEESIFITNADPAVYISEGIEYADQGSNIAITATIYSSNLNTISVEWYHEGTLINTVNNPRYSENMENMNSRSVLNIMNVDTDILGEYTVVVNSEGRSENDSVQLVFPVPPSSSVSPSRQAVDEGEAVQFQCQASGTELTIRWTREGDQPLPTGVIQNGGNLVVESVSRIHTGNYECIVINSAGATATSVAVLTVFYAPTSSITHDGIGRTSMNQLLSVISEDGDPAPTFSCTSDGFPLPTLTWSVMGGGDLPSGVVESTVSPRRILLWTRQLGYRDSGRYECTAQNSHGTSRTILDLLVQQPPIISSISPNSLVTLSTLSTLTNFLVPEGYSGTILTCAAYGWPRPSIEWLRNGQQDLEGNRMVSDSTSSNQDSAFVSARLRWIVGFGESDIGNYTCIVRANDTNAIQSKSISLEQTLPATPTPNPVQCSVSSDVTYFQIRILDTECLTWNPDLKEHIRASFLTEIINIIESECSGCEVTSDNVGITELPRCSDLVDRAAFFTGSITTPQRGTTEDLFCALNRWQANGPIVQINSRFHRVDSNCSLMTTSLTSSECSTANGSVHLTREMIYIIAGAMGGLVLLLIVFTICLCCCIYCFCCSRRDSKGLNQSSNQSNYDRTYLGGDSRYTSRVNPIPNQRPLSDSDSIGKIPPPIYSTLEREMNRSTTVTSSFSSTLPPQTPPFSSQTSPLPPPPPFQPGGYSFEMRPLQEDPRSHMMVDEVDGGGGRERGGGSAQFQLIHDGNGVGSSAARPYLISTNSSVSLGTNTNADGESLVKQDHGLINRAGDSFVQQDVTDPPQTSVYEQVDRNSSSGASNSPLRVIRPNSGKSGTHRPLMMISSTKDIAHQQEAGGRSFKRHMSAVENSRHNSHDDYSLLNRNEVGRQVPPPLGHPTSSSAGVQKGRSMSLKSAAPPPLSHYPRPGEKRPSITNYDRTVHPHHQPHHHPASPGIKSSTSAISASTGSSEPPPPYHDVPPRDFPHLSAAITLSLRKNSSYGQESSTSPLHDREGTLEESDGEVFQQPWYHNASDFSVNHSNTASESGASRRGRREEERSTIVPHSSHVSRAGEGVPRSSLSRREGPEYPQHTQSGGGGGARGGGDGGDGGSLVRGVPSNTHFQTVLV